MRRLILLVVLAACPGPRGGAAGDAGFHVFYPDAPVTGFRAKLGKRFQIKPTGRCTYDDGRDARWTMTGARVDHGELPPGLVIEDGAIGGVPTQAGTWTARIKFAGVACAGEHYGDQYVDVTITAAAR